MSPWQKIFLTLLFVTTTVTAQFKNEQQITTKEEFEELFDASDELKKGFHSLHSLAYLFVRDTNGNWQPLVPNCVAEILTETTAMVHHACFEQVLEVYNASPQLDDLRLVYRCFKSDNPYDFDLHTAAIDKVEDDISMAVFVLSFTPQPSTNGCRIRPFMKMDPDVLLEHAKELGGRLASATEGVTPLSRETFEAALLNKNAFEEGKWLTYVFQRNLDTLSTELEPIRECVVKLTSEGAALVQQLCGTMLTSYRTLNEKLPNCLLPIRCYRHDDPTEYDLQVVAIEDVFKAVDSQFYVITYTRPKSDSCSPVWANDAEVLPTKRTLKTEQQQYLASLTKDRFEDAFSDLEQMPKLLPYIGFIFHPDLNTNEKILAPIPNCQVMLFSPGKALIGYQCARIIKIFANAVSNLSSWDTLLLAYRCYLVDNPNEYELHVVNLEKLGKEPKQGLQFVHFKTKESDQCRAKWSGEMPEDVALDHLQRMEHTEL